MEEGEGNTVVFTYDHFGDSITSAIGKDLTGGKFVTSSRELPGAPLKRNLLGAMQAENLFANDFKGFQVAAIVKKIDRVINSCAPIADEGEFTNAHGKTVKYRSCMLPFTAPAKGQD